MDAKFNELELAAFLDYVSDKGLLNSNTAQGRKVAALKVLGALDDHEKVDLRSINREVAFNRFVNRFGKSFNPSSLKIYKSRFNSTLDDFIRYQTNPSGFKIGTSTRATTKRSEKPGSNPQNWERGPTRNTTSTSQEKGNRVPTTVVFPIPLREGVVVQIHDLPNDLTRAEADRISAVVSALAIAERG